MPLYLRKRDLSRFRTKQGNFETVLCVKTIKTSRAVYIAIMEMDKHVLGQDAMRFVEDCSFQEFFLIQVSERILRPSK